MAILVAYDDTPGQLGSTGSSGFARRVVPGGASGGRHVSNLSNLFAVDGVDVPEPEGAQVLAAAPLGLMACRHPGPRAPLGA